MGNFSASHVALSTIFFLLGFYTKDVFREIEKIINKRRCAQLRCPECDKKLGVDLVCWCCYGKVRQRMLGIKFDT